MMEVVVGNSRGSVETGLTLDLGPSGECDVPRQRDVLRIFRHVEVRLTSESGSMMGVCSAKMARSRRRSAA
jgi:hypothetical protein